MEPHYIYPIMPDPRTDIPTRAPAATSEDDTILPFQVEALDLRGRVVRFGPAIDTILSRHRYPAPVAKLLGEAIVLTVLLGSTLKFEGRFILQTQSDGPVRMLVIDYTTPGKVRACARFDAARVAAAIAAGAADPGALLGRGHLAMTIDQGPDTARYQGIVALEGKDLEHAAHEYFLRSEQIPTRVRLAVAEELRAGANGARHRWRAGGLLLQFLPQSPERARQPDLDPGDVPEGVELEVAPEDDAWVEGRSLVATVEDVELLDPEVSAEQLLYRLFHERGVRVFRSQGFARPMLVLARRRRADAAQLPPGRPRPHGRERQDHGHLRVLQLDLCVRADGGERADVRRRHTRRVGKPVPAPTGDRRPYRCRMKRGARDFAHASRLPQRLCSAWARRCSDLRGEPNDVRGSRLCPPYELLFALIDRPRALRGVEREGRNVDVELARRSRSPCRRCRS